MGDRHDDTVRGHGAVPGDDAVPGHDASPRIDETALHRLLSERPGSPPPRNLSSVARVLDAVSTPCAPGDRGERSAVAAFRALRAERPTRRPQRTRTTVLGVAMVIVLGSGVAFAASAGVRFPTERRPAASPSPTDAGTAVPRDPSATEDGGSLPGSPDVPGPTGTAPSTSPDHGAGPEGEQQWKPLCDAFHRRPADQRERALGQPRFQPLVSAAGGQDRVEDFCAALVGSPPATPGNARGPGPHHDVPTTHQPTDGHQGRPGEGDDPDDGAPGGGATGGEGDSEGGDSGSDGGGGSGGSTGGEDGGGTGGGDGDGATGGSTAGGDPTSAPEEPTPTGDPSPGPHDRARQETQPEDAQPEGDQTEGEQAEEEQTAADRTEDERDAPRQDNRESDDRERQGESPSSPGHPVGQYRQGAS